MKIKVAFICVCIALVCTGCNSDKEAKVNIDTEQLISDISIMANWRYTGDKESMMESARRICSATVYEELMNSAEQSTSIVDITGIVTQSITDNGYMDANIKEVDGSYYIDSNKIRTYGGYALVIVGDTTLKIELPESVRTSSYVGNTGYQIDVLDYNIYDNGDTFVKVKIGAFNTISYEEFIKAHPELEDDTYQGEGQYAIYTADSRGEIERTYKLRLNKDGKISSVSNMELFIGDIIE